MNVRSNGITLSSRNAIRRLAIQCRLEGMSVQSTSVRCGLSATTVRSLWKAFQVGGWNAVDVKRLGRPIGAGRVVSGGQEEQIVAALWLTEPGDVGLPSRLWSRTTVRQFIRQQFGIFLEERTLSHYLLRWGFTATPIVPFSRTVVAQARFASARLFCIQETVTGIALRREAPHRRMLTAVSPKGVCLWAAFASEQTSMGHDFIERLVTTVDAPLFIAVAVQGLDRQELRRWMLDRSLAATLVDGDGQSLSTPATR